MLYAKEVIELMAAFPGRPFTVNRIVNYVQTRSHTKASKEALRKGIRRVLRELETNRQIRIETNRKSGAAFLYVWKPLPARDCGESGTRGY